MVQITEEMLRDDNHWQVDLKGKIDGRDDVVRSYHLAAGSRGEVRRLALLKWGGEFDEIPYIQRIERYRPWRLYERSAEGRCGE